MTAPDTVLLERFEALSTRLLDEVGTRNADDPVHSSLWPTVGAVAGHVADIYTWVATILRTGAAAGRTETVLDDESKTSTLTAARSAVLGELRHEDRECWIIGGRTGTTAFWRRRMVLETLKHLLDLRTLPGEHFVVPAELEPDLAADGVDEFFDVFLARSRPTLPPLPGSILLRATDKNRTWHLATEWTITDDGPASATIDAPAAVILLLLWERASVLDEPERFGLSGDRDAVRALESAPIHP